MDFWERVLDFVSTIEGKGVIVVVVVVVVVFLSQVLLLAKETVRQAARILAEAIARGVHVVIRNGSDKTGANVTTVDCSAGIDAETPAHQRVGAFTDTTYDA